MTIPAGKKEGVRECTTRGRLCRYTYTIQMGVPTRFTLRSALAVVACLCALACWLHSGMGSHAHAKLCVDCGQLHWSRTTTGGWTRSWSSANRATEILPPCGQCAPLISFSHACPGFGCDGAHLRELARVEFLHEAGVLQTADRALVRQVVRWLLRCPVPSDLDDEYFAAGCEWRWRRNFATEWEAFVRRLRSDPRVGGTISVFESRMVSSRRAQEEP